MKMQEKTLVLIKPDAFEKQHTGDIIAIYEKAGLKILAMKLMQMTPRVAQKHYAEHIGRPYYAELEEFAPQIIYIHTTNRNITEYPFVENRKKNMPAPPSLDEINEKIKNIRSSANEKLSQIKTEDITKLGNSWKTMLGGTVEGNREATLQSRTLLKERLAAWHAN